jgi:hypothetical protein
MCYQCLEEMQEAYEYQEDGYDIAVEEKNGHLFFFIIKGKEIIRI